MAEEVRAFFMCGYFCEFLLLMPKFFFGNLLFTTKTGVKVQILQNDKKVDVCVEMQTELWYNHRNIGVHRKAINVRLLCVP